MVANQTTNFLYFFVSIGGVKCHWADYYGAKNLIHSLANLAAGIVWRKWSILKVGILSTTLTTYEEFSIESTINIILWEQMLKFVSSGYQPTKISTLKCKRFYTANKKKTATNSPYPRRSDKICSDTISICCIYLYKIFPKFLPHYTNQVHCTCTYTYMYKS